MGTTAYVFEAARALAARRPKAPDAARQPLYAQGFANLKTEEREPNFTPEPLDPTNHPD